MLDHQIYIYGIDTGNFYSNHEAYLHWRNHKLRKERKELRDKISDIDKKIEKFRIESDNDGLNSLYSLRRDLEGLIGHKNHRIKDTKNRLLGLLGNKIDANIKSGGKHHIRQLNESSLSENDIISVFDSSLTRTIGAEYDELTEDLIVVQIYYFDVMKDLIYFGFMYKGEKYVYFTSSAGQIRTKKCVFIKESTFKEHEMAIMCGLTVDKINEKGGCNPN